MGGNERKILFHINSLGKGGAERVVTLLSGYFAKDGYEVVIATLWRAEEEYQVPAGVRRISLGDLASNKRCGRLRLALKRFTDLRRVIKKEAPDLVISFCNKANFRSAFGMAGMRIPLLVSVRNDPQMDYAPHKFSTWRMEQKAAGCVFQTPQAKAFFAPGLQKKSRIIFNPVDEKYLLAGQGKRLCKEKAGRRSGDIVCVGRISAQKNHMLLLKAFSRVKDQFPEFKVRIYGEEGEPGIRQELDRYIEQKKMKDRVIFMGQCSFLEEEIGNAALFVLPSDYEGMSNSLAEAMVLGLPVIATDCPCGGSALLIENGVSGILVPTGEEKPLAEAMEKLLSDRALAESMAANARKVADKVSPLKVYGKWRAYVEELMNIS